MHKSHIASKNLLAAMCLLIFSQSAHAEWFGYWHFATPTAQRNGHAPISCNIEMNNGVEFNRLSLQQPYEIGREVVFATWASPSISFLDGEEAELRIGESLILGVVSTRTLSSISSNVIIRFANFDIRKVLSELLIDRQIPIEISTKSGFKHRTIISLPNRELNGVYACFATLTVDACMRRASPGENDNRGFGVAYQFLNEEIAEEIIDLCSLALSFTKVSPELVGALDDGFRSMTELNLARALIYFGRFSEADPILWRLHREDRRGAEFFLALSAALNPHSTLSEARIDAFFNEAVREGFPQAVGLNLAMTLQSAFSSLPGRMIDTLIAEGFKPPQNSLTQDYRTYLDEAYCRAYGSC